MCVVCKRVDREAAAIVGPPYGAVAQLVEHHTGSVRVARSSRVSSTHSPFFLGGVVAGEGTFVVTLGNRMASGERALRFVFQLTMASRDRSLLESLRGQLGFGSINDRAARRSHWQPSSTLSIASRKAHLAATIPFMDAYLLAPTHKRVQYEQWKGALLAYDVERPRKVGRSTCSEPDCNGLVRGRGLCRSHYYRATGW